MINKASSSNRILLLLIIPAMILYGVFKLSMIPYSGWLSFTNFSFIGERAVHYDFVGFGNYFKILSDPKFWESTKNSLIYTFFCAMIGQFWLGFFMAVIISNKNFRENKLKSILIIVAIATWVLPDTIGGFEWFSLLDRRFGLVNNFLEFLHFNRVPWMDMRQNILPGIPFALFSLIIANIWKGSSFTMIIFSSALETVPPELYDAAEVDGATGFHKLRYITIPMVKYVMPVVLIVLFMGSFMQYTFVYIFTAGTWYEANLAIYSWATAFKYYEIGTGCALSMVVIIIYLIMGNIQQRVTTST